MSKDVESRRCRPYPWMCARCGKKEIYPAAVEYSTEIDHDGRTYAVSIPALQTHQCRNCKELVFDTEANRQITEAFRRVANLLTPEEIRQNRQRLGLTQPALAERLEVGPATLSRWETGAQVQQRSLDKLLRLYFTLPEVRRALEPPMQGSLRGLPGGESASNPQPEHGGGPSVDADGMLRAIAWYVEERLSTVVELRDDRLPTIWKVTRSVVPQPIRHSALCIGDSSIDLQLHRTRIGRWGATLRLTIDGRPDVRKVHPRPQEKAVKAIGDLIFTNLPYLLTRSADRSPVFDRILRQRQEREGQSSPGVAG